MKTILRTSVNVLPIWLRHWIRHIPGLAAVQRWMVSHIMSGESFVHTINAGPAAGARFEIRLPEDKAIWTGTYEFDFATAVRSAVKKGDICYDVGGYRGYLSAVMALAGAAKVIVFEPLPENQRNLTRLIELNPSLRIELLRIAASDRDGRLQLHVMEDPSMAKLDTSSFQKTVRSTAQIEVLARTIDSLINSSEISPPNLMKIDVEGAEIDVLHGSTMMLTKIRPKIFLEAHSSSLERACIEELTGHGYDVRRLVDKPLAEEQPRHLLGIPRRDE